jgi:hypothetical protein
MQKVIAKLDSIHAALLGTVDPIDPELFTRRPSENEWSIGENLHHLCIVEGLVLKTLNAGLARPPHQLSLLNRLFPVSLVGWRGIKAKAPKAAEPLNAPPKEAVIANLDRVRESIKEFSSTHGRERLLTIPFKHPFLGTWDGVTAVRFVGYHELRHHKQIKEIIRRLASS